MPRLNLSYFRSIIIRESTVTYHRRFTRRDRRIPDSRARVCRLSRDALFGTARGARYYEILRTIRHPPGMNTAPYAANAFSSAPWECFWPYVSALTPAATPLRSTLVCTRCQTFWIREFRRDSCVSQIHHGNSCDPDDLSGKFLPSPFMQRGQWPRSAAAALAALQDRGLRHHSSKIKPYQADPRFSNLPTCLTDVALPRFTSAAARMSAYKSRDLYVKRRAESAAGSV